MNLKKKLKFCLDNNFNVLLEGKHGVGKSAIVTEVFEEAGLNWKYFSASTMDPWVDFVGIPKEKETEQGSHIELVKPKHFQYDEIEAIHFDEFNRTDDKVLNCTMELIQFKSINGHKLENLRVIWASINPFDEEDLHNGYKVNRLDEAQRDRFQVHIKVPYKVSSKYFSDNYGYQGEAATKWWNNLSKEFKEEVSPRRLEYALDYYQMGGDSRDVLPECVNSIEFEKNLSNISIKDIKDSEKEEFVKNANNRRKLWGHLKGSARRISEWIEYLPESFIVDKVSKEVDSSKTSSMLKAIVKNKNSDKIKNITRNLSKTDGNREISKLFKIIDGQNSKVCVTEKSFFDFRPDDVQYYHGTDPSLNNIKMSDIDAALKAMKSKDSNTYHRKTNMKDVCKGVSKSNMSTLSNEKMRKIVNLIYMFIDRTRKSTFSRWNYAPDTIITLNSCLYEFYRRAKVLDTDAKQMFPTLFSIRRMNYLKTININSYPEFYESKHGGPYKAVGESIYNIKRLLNEV